MSRITDADLDLLHAVGTAITLACGCKIRVSKYRDYYTLETNGEQYYGVYFALFVHKIIIFADGEPKHVQWFSSEPLVDIINEYAERVVNYAVQMHINKTR